MLFQTTFLILTMATAMALFMTHPVSIIIVIIIQTLMLAMILAASLYSPWFSYILFLVFLGGMLILFSYITSLAANQTFKPSIMLTTTALTILLTKMIIPTKMLAEPTVDATPQTSMMKLFFQDMTMTIIAAIFLLIVLLSVVQITSNFKGPIQASPK